MLITEGDRALLAGCAAPDALRAKLQRATTVSARAMPPDVVTLGSLVAYCDETARVRRTVTLVLPQHAKASAARVSVLSPAGAALFGMRAGEAAPCDFADGTRRRLHIEYVLHQPERALGLAIGA